MGKSKFSNRIFNRLRWYIVEMKQTMDTIFMGIMGYLHGVTIGEKCKFYGVSHFEICNGGSITIGDKCIFRSMSTSNRIGLNHKCIISATPAISPTATILIGDNCGFSGTSIWCFKSITIGNNVRCGANTLIMDGDAHYEDERTLPPQSIVIEDNVFLGANVTVKKGVTIGANSVIGMNSVVTHDIPANCVAVGSPAKIMRKLR
jgi:acetyltransferase-like isoleucine patch superfamily enzyme